MNNLQLFISILSLLLAMQTYSLPNPQQKPKTNTQKTPPKQAPAAQPSPPKEAPKAPQPAAATPKQAPKAPQPAAATPGKGTKAAQQAPADAKKSGAADSQQSTGPKDGENSGKQPGDFKWTPAKGPNPPGYQPPPIDRKYEEALHSQGMAGKPVDLPNRPGTGSGHKVGPDGQWQQTSKDGQQLVNPPRNKFYTPQGDLKWGQRESEAASNAEESDASRRRYYNEMDRLGRKP